VFDEPYRWVEAVGQRRDYIEEQLKRSSPVIAQSVTEGILFFTFYRRMPKVFEVYDGIAMGAIGHPADIESARMMLLNAAHVEGFQRSPKDVTLNRLVLFVLAPRLKTAFEEVMSPPLIFRSILAETGPTPESDTFYLVDYDGNVNQAERQMVAAGTESSQGKALSRLKKGKGVHSLEKSLPVLLEAFLYASLGDDELGIDPSGNWVDPEKLQSARKKLLEESCPNITLLDRKKGILVGVDIQDLKKDAGIS
jgi:proteasome alpha subunit